MIRVGRSSSIRFRQFGGGAQANHRRRISVHHLYSVNRPRREKRLYPWGSHSIGVRICMLIKVRSSGAMRLSVSVRIRPGNMVLQRIPFFPYCVTTSRIRLTTAAYDAP